MKSTEIILVTVLTQINFSFLVSDKFEALTKINDTDFEIKFENFQAIHHTEKNMHYGLLESLLHNFFYAMSENESILAAESIIDT